MNLHGIVRGVITAVNPDTPVTVNVNQGNVPAADGTQTPAITAFSRMAQIQALDSRDLRQIEGLNLQGIVRKFYFYGEVDGLVRMLNKGGDSIVVADGSPNTGTWLVNQISEQWPDWCCVIATLQNGS